ncbi:MAG TPA: tRNA (adenosine(37)-N6)-threonylcarbamoyltransferase complex dimerization subunit type 1 TsaB [Candidatus Saccharimonadales bacterium]|jgi:tRNA threonylcarbamoyladenosine biosynthesis protein TsaB
MLILAARTDKPDAELYLFRATEKLAEVSWLAHRQLAETLHLKVKELLDAQGLTLTDLEGVCVYQGPGSFTGLRIGLSVTNALAYSLEIPIVTQSGDGWLQQGINRLTSGGNDLVAMPEYGAEVHITPHRTVPRTSVRPTKH